MATTARRHAVVERYRAKLRATGFTPLDDAATDALRQAYAAMAHSNAIEGIVGTAESNALFAMFVEERAPPQVTDLIVEDYLTEHVARRGLGAHKGRQRADEQQREG